MPGADRPSSPAPSQSASEHALKICMLASGSKGNSIYISNGAASLLIDAGLAGIEIERRMASRHISFSEIDAVIVSHEHSDHIKGVGVLARKYKLPVFISNNTHKAAAGQLGKIDVIRPFSCGASFAVKDLTVRPFSVSHDADDPAGFIVESNGKKIGIATDLGIATTVVKERLKGCACIVLEANHDPHMLENGPYPWPLKQRIKSRIGHLSNQSSKELLMEVLHDGLSHVILAHLSETNNTPEKALSVITERLSRHHPKISVAGQHVAGPVILL